MQLPPMPPRRGEDDSHLIPLINIVFLLLIFFMLAGALTRPDPFAVEPPASARAGESPGEALQILLNREGRLALDGQPLEMQALKTRLARAVEAAAEEGEGVTVHLRADRRVSSARLLDLTRQMQETGVERIFLLTLKARGETP
ncbi:outer membrane transport energization protein ExbD [Ectothiorhodospira mobilis]|uniref:Outer membrane transport energization protein ExbD n=1 Tax=Ectothiorhodospira mobilis TaxID=195064 RepID=A0A1I4SNY4_ECTMO|nr:biopolymer transporter ExbD [Ectothiorhodospira mobilis]SFM66194.1 outer membrane transport energization protein ExbD [Ectothiorhodospira mobilis]